MFEGNRSAFSGAECYFWMPKYDESVRRYATLALRYQGRPEELIALNQLYVSYYNEQQTDKAMATFKRLQKALEEMPDAAFDGSTPQHARIYWLKLLEEATKPAIPPAAGAPPPGKK